MKDEFTADLKRVLVPVDFSEPSRSALRYALSLSKPFKAEIHLLHVVQALVFPPDVEVVETATVAARLNEEAAKRLSAWALEAAEEGVVVVKDLRIGGPYNEIVDAATETKADLIVMGTQGRSGLGRLFIGSTAERVVRHAPCPVLVVREHAEEAESRTAEEESESAKPHHKKARRREKALAA